MSSQPSSKRQKTSDHSGPEYELLYWPSLPGRGEHIRLCFEDTKTPYKDTTNESKKEGMPALLQQISPDFHGSGANLPALAPPILKHGDLTISQTPNILLYLGSKLGLAGPVDDANAVYRINQLALTALDGFSNEAHDSHHPIGIAFFYEQQKEEAKRRAKDYVENRIPKYLAYFERVLSSSPSGEATTEQKEFLYGGVLTWADLVLWQCLDGVGFAFPKAMTKMKESGKYKNVFALQGRIGARENIESYVQSERRIKYANGIWRYYPELDLQDE